MPTKDQRIADLEKENASLREQIKYCNLALGDKGKPAEPPAVAVPIKPPEPVKSEEQPAAAAP